MQSIEKNCPFLTEEEIDTVSSYIPQKNDLKKLEQVFSALSVDTRLKIVCALSIKCACVSDLLKLLNINQTTLSHQLAFLKSAGIVDCERRGKVVVYFISNKSIFSLLSAGVDFIDKQEECNVDICLD